MATLSTRDPGQIAQLSFNPANNSINVTPVGGSIITVPYDSIQLAYTGSNLTTVTYYLASVLVNTLTLSYDGSNNLISVVKT